ncbi:hypothetical protein JCM10135_09840 [Stetteria hydrogenophila]
MWGVSALLAGPLVEPLLHPKPAAVTRLVGHRDKSVLDFAVHAVALAQGMMASCASRGDRVADGLRVYRLMLDRLGIRGNVAAGTAFLMIPLAAALGAAGKSLSARELASLASEIAASSGPRATLEYYRLLERLRPSHLRRYKGPVPAVGARGPLPPLVDVLRASSWDLVHSEVLGGYRRTLSVAERLGCRPLRPEELEERALAEMLRLLASHGDTLIRAKWGSRAYLQAKLEAREALLIAERRGVRAAAEWLDGLWRPRGWNPGAVLDVIAAALGLHFYALTSKAGL